MTSVSLHKELFVCRKELGGSYKTLIIKVDSINLQTGGQVNVYVPSVRTTRTLSNFTKGLHVSISRQFPILSC